MKAVLKKFGLSLFAAAVTLLWTTCDVGLGDSVDTMAPTVSISSPANSDVCAGTIALSGDCADDKGVFFVSVVITNTNTGENFLAKVKANTVSSWETTINELAEEAGFNLKDGSYTADATAVDIFGRNSGTASAAFDIDNTPPLFCVTSPATLDISNPRQYGRSVTISGEIADDHDIDRMNIRVFKYENGASTEITSSLAKTEFKGFETAGGTTVYVAKYFDTAPIDAQSEDYKLYQNYMAIYGSATNGADALVYIVPTLTDVAGNTSQACYLSSELKNLAAEICGVPLGLDSLQTAQLMKIYNGTYSLGEFNDEQKGKINSLLSGNYQLKDGQKAYYSRYVDGDAAQQSPLAACVNPDNAPTYEFSGYENPVTSPNGWVGVNTGGNLTLTIKAGRDGWGILPGSITVNLYSCDEYGNKTLGMPSFSTRNELDPTGAATVIVRDAANKEIANIETSVTNQSYYVTLPALRAGNRYIIEATGRDENESELVAYRGNVYGFAVASSITAPKLTASDLFYVAGAGAKADGGCTIRMDIKDDSDEIGENGVTVDAYLCKDHIAAKSYISAYIADKTPTKTVVYKNSAAQTVIKPAVDESGKETPNRYWFDLAVKDFAFNIEDNTHYTVVLCARAGYKDIDGNLVESNNTNFMFWIDNKAPAISIASPSQDGELVTENFASYDSESSSITFSGNWNDLGGANTHRMWWTASDQTGTPSVVWTPCAAGEKYAAGTYYYKVQYAAPGKDCYALLDTEKFVAGETSVAGYYKMGIASDTGGAWTEIADLSQVASQSSWEQKVRVEQGRGKFFRLVGADAVGNLSAPVERKDLTYDFEVPAIAMTSEPADTGYYNASHVIGDKITLYYKATDSYQINAADIKVTAQKWNDTPMPPAAAGYETVAKGENGFDYEATQDKDEQGNDDAKKVVVAITLSTKDAGGAAIDIDGKWKWTVEAKDAAGRPAQSVSLERIVDTKAPAFQGFKDKTVTDASGATTTRTVPALIKDKAIAVGSGDWSVWTYWENVWYSAAGLAFNGNLAEEGSGLAKICYTLTTPANSEGVPGQTVTGETTDLKAEFGSVDKPVEFVLNAIGFEESVRKADGSLNSNTLEIYAIDKAGNVSAKQQLTINIDQSQPNAAAAYYTYIDSPAPTDLAVAEGTLVSDGTKNMTVYGSLSNELSGVKELSWSVKPSDGGNEKAVTPKSIKYTTNASVKATAAKPRADADKFAAIAEGTNDGDWQDYSAIADKAKITGWKAVLIPAEVSATATSPAIPKSLYSGDHYITAYSAAGKNSKNPAFTVDRDDIAPTIGLNDPATRPVSYRAVNGGEVVSAKYFDAAPADTTSEEYKQWQKYKEIFKITSENPVPAVHSVNGTINISGIAEDKKELASVKVYWSYDSAAEIKDGDVEITNIGDSKNNWTFDHYFSKVEGGKFIYSGGSEYSGTPQTLYIKVAAADTAQNQTITVYEYSVDPDSDRPEITFKTPENLAGMGKYIPDPTKPTEYAYKYILKEQTPLLKGKIKDDDGLAGLTMFYNDNDEKDDAGALVWNPVSMTSDTFSIFTDSTLRDGKHKLLLKVIDAKGTEFVTSVGGSEGASWLRPKIYDSSDTTHAFGTDNTGDSVLYIQIDTQKPKISPVYYYAGETAIDLAAADAATPPTDPIGALPTNFDGQKVGGIKNKFTIYLYTKDESGIDKDTIALKFARDGATYSLANSKLTVTDPPKASAYKKSDGWMLITVKDITVPDKDVIANGKDEKYEGVITVSDMVSQSSEAKVSVTVDNTPPTVDLVKPEKNSTQTVSGSVNAYGTVKNSDDGTKVYYGLSFEDDTHNEAAATAGPLDLPKKSAEDTEIVKYAEINRSNNYLMWYVYFDSDSRYDDNDKKTHSYTFNEYLVKKGASIGGVTASAGTHGTIADGTFKKDGGIPIYLWIKAVDSVGNEKVEKYKILHDPQGTKPTVNFTFPSKNKEVMGDIFTIYGTAKANDPNNPTIKAVFLQFISTDHNKITKDGAVIFDPATVTSSDAWGGFGKTDDAVTWFTPSGLAEGYMSRYLQFAGYDLYNMETYGRRGPHGEDESQKYNPESPDRDELFGALAVLGANGNSWSIRLNSKGEFNPDKNKTLRPGEKNVNEVAVRVFAYDGKNFSLPETKWFVVDGDTPYLVDEKLKSETSATGYSRDKDVCLTGDWNLQFTVCDGSSVGTVDIGMAASETDAKNNRKTYFKSVLKDDNTYEVIKQESCVTTPEGTAANGYTKVTVDYPLDTGSGCGVKYVSVRYEDNTANGGEQLYKITYDNVAPVLEPKPAEDDPNASDSAYKIEELIQQKNGWHSFGSRVTEAPVDSGGVMREQSGFARVAFYFTRKLPNGYTVALDPMYKRGSEGDRSEISLRNGSGNLDLNWSFENGLYWRQVRANLDSNLPKTINVDDTVPTFLHVGGLIKVNGVIYTIKSVSGQSVGLDGDPVFAQGDDYAYVALANVVDNPIQESETATRSLGDANGYGFGYCDKPLNDDGDMMIETVVNNGSSWDWDASIYSKNFVDGPVELHYVAFDKAGNWAQAGGGEDYGEGKNSHGVRPQNNPPVVKATVSNNQMRLANLYVGTDLNGDSLVGGAGDAYETASGEWKVPFAGLDAQSLTWNQDTNSGTAKVDQRETQDNGNVTVTPAATLGEADRAYLIAKGKTIVRPEILGGNGSIKLECAINNQKLQNPFGMSFIRENFFTPESYEIANPLQNEKTRSKDITFQVGDFNHIDNVQVIETIPDCDSDKPHEFRFKFFDQTLGVNEADRVPLTAVVYMAVSMSDSERPTAKYTKDGSELDYTAHPLYWKGKGDGNNSVVWNGSTPLGHIDLGDDLPDDFTDPAPSEAKTIKGTPFPAALMDRDSKVSGKIVLTGKVHDNKMLDHIYLAIPNMDAMFGTGKANLAGVDYPKDAATPIGKRWRVATYNAKTATWTQPIHGKKADGDTDPLANYGIQFDVVRDEISDTGHTAHWKLVWDTSKIANAADLDVKVDVWASDQKVSSQVIYSPSGEEGVDYVTGVTGDAWYTLPAYAENNIGDDKYESIGATEPETRYHPKTLKLDVVPYITSLVTKLFEKGASNGMGPAYARTAKGHWPVFYHRDSTDTAGTYTESAEQFTVEGFNFADWQTSKTESGWLTATVGGVPSLNNVNNNDAALGSGGVSNAYNRQPNGKNNDNLTDDVYIDVWQINGKAAIRGDLTINAPVMKINPADGANGMIGFGFEYGQAGNSFVMPNGKTSSYMQYHRGHDTKNSFTMAIDDRGNVFGVCADADSGFDTGANQGTYSDSFILHSSIWGAVGDTGQAIVTPSNCMQLDCTGQKGDKYNTSDFDFAGEILKQQSPSIATAGSNVYLAYYDAFNKEIRFRSNLKRSFNINKNRNSMKEGVGNFKSLDYGKYGVQSHTYEKSLENCQVVATSNTTAKSGNYVALAALPEARAGSNDDVVAIVWYDTANNKLWYSYNKSPSENRTGMTTTAATHTVAKGATYKLPDDELPSNVKRKSAVAIQGTHYTTNGSYVEKKNAGDTLRVDTEKTYSLAAGAGVTWESSPAFVEEVSTVKYKIPRLSEAVKDTHYTLSDDKTTYTPKEGVASLRFETQKAYEIKTGQTFKLAADEALSKIQYRSWTNADENTHYTHSGNTYTAKAGALLFDINKTYALAKIDADTFVLPSGEVLTAIEYRDGNVWKPAEKGAHYSLSEDGTYTDKAAEVSSAAVPGADYALAGNEYTAIAELLQFDFNKTHVLENRGDTFSLDLGDVLTGNIEYKDGDVWKTAVRDTHYTLSDEGIYTTLVANVRFTVKTSKTISKGQMFQEDASVNVTRITSIANLRFLVKTSRAIGKYGTFKLAAGEDVAAITYYDVWSPAAIDTDYTLSADGKTYTAKAERLQFDFDETHVLENERDTFSLDSGDVLTGNIEYKEGDVWKTAVKDTHYTISADGATYTAKVANVRFTVKTSSAISKDETFQKDASVNVTRITRYSGDTWADAVKGAQYKLSNAGVYTAKTDLLFETIKSYETSGSFTVPAGETVLSVKRQDFDAGYDLMDAVEGQHYTYSVEPNDGYTVYKYNAMAPLEITTKKHSILNNYQSWVSINGETLNGVVLVGGTSDAVKGVDYTLSDNGVYTAITDELTINTRKLPAGKINSQTGASADGWSAPVSLFSSKVGMYCKAAFDANKGVHIAAYDSGSGSLWYAYLSEYNKTGSANVKVCRVDTGMVGFNIDIDVALDSGEAMPCISYYALGENTPKFARLANAGTFGDGIENGKYTGIWDVSYVPTDSPLVRDNTSVGLWKGALSAESNAGVLKYSTTDGAAPAANNIGKSTSANNNTSVCYGNGSKNAVLGYKNIDKSDVTRGYFETAQLTGTPEEAY